MTNWLALGFLGVVVVLLFFTSAGRTALVVGVVFGAAVCGGYALLRARVPADTN